MKKIVLILFTAVIALLITACQPTPKKEAVIQKDTGSMIEQAQNEVNNANTKDAQTKKMKLRTKALSKIR